MRLGKTRTQVINHSVNGLSSQKMKPEMPRQVKKKKKEIPEKKP